jgi:hypothetical protein
VVDRTGRQFAPTLDERIPLVWLQRCYHRMSPIQSNSDTAKVGVRFAKRASEKAEVNSASRPLLKQDRLLLLYGHFTQAQ